MKKLLLALLFLLNSLAVLATHFRAGEITYRRVSGFTYEATVTVYMKESSSATSQQTEVVIYWGDGDSSVIPRISSVSLGNDVNKSIYVGSHTYPGAFQYEMTVLERNRNADINNIPGSVNVPFYLKSLLVINNTLGSNRAPVLTNPPIDDACINKCFIHNPGAYDPDGDSLVYSLVPSLGENAQPVPGYTFPNEKGGGTISIDQNGDLVWCSPGSTAQGEWNVAILISEYRKYGNGYILMGQTLRDMQITVLACTNNPPNITAIKDTCVEAGKTLAFNVTATDADADVVTLSASGAPFQVSPSASFPSVSGNLTVTSIFSWTPGCGNVRTQSYLATFKAVDDDQIQLVDYESVNIKVIGPAVTGFTVVPSGSSMNLSWDANFCTNVVQYKIYRKEECALWTHGPCETGVPAYLGYTHIGTTTATSFIDNNNGQGLIQGVSYSYIVVSVFRDGSESYASAQVCVNLVKDVPIITNVSVTYTDNVNGAMFIRWEKPVAGATNLDTTLLTGPYTFTLMRGTGFTGPLTQVTSFSSPYFATLNTLSYRDTFLNTLDNPYNYRIDFSSNNNFIGSSGNASSVYLNVSPSDNKLTLTWDEKVPWENYKYYIEQEISPNTYILIDSTSSKTYIVDSLINGATYCYRIKSFGEYSDPTIIKPLINDSERKCGMPQDLTSPCPPVLSINSDCNVSRNDLTWTNPNNLCADDVVKYNIYYAAVQGQPYLYLTTINSSIDTFYSYINVNSIAGCFVVTAVDTFNNESAYSNSICVDNCPVYKLPNVFTPDGDGKNVLFHPFPYKFVKDVDIKIYDRWGVLMFETTDPDVMWDGKNKDSKKPVTQGVYYYTCVVNEIRVSGIVPREIRGFVHVLYDKFRAAE